MLAIAAALVFAAPAPAASVYWGANIGPHLTGGQPPYDMAAADSFEALAGKRMSLIGFSLPWAYCFTQPCEFRGFPTAQMEAIRQRGAIPAFGWASYSQPLTEDQPDFKLSKIAAGAYDAEIRQWATDAKAWGHAFFLLFDWEMNLHSVWPYVEARSGNQPGDFVKMWRHVHDIFTEVGATNVTWTWCPNIEYPGSAKPLSSLYPGDAYVDWTCIDGYNWGTQLNGWHSFREMLGPTYDVVQEIAPSKPVLIGETASTELGGSKPAWIRDALEVQLPRTYPNVKGLVWFEQNDTGVGVDWRIETTEESRSAFATGIQSTYYAENAFADVASPIPPLSPLAPVARSPAPGTGAGSEAHSQTQGTGTGTGTTSKTPRCVFKRSKTTGKRVRVCRRPRCVFKRSRTTGKRVRVCTAKRPAKKPARRRATRKR